MLIAYLDEVGEPGAFVDQNHPKYKTSPGFGYAGFILPEQNVRRFGARFTARKRELFKTEITTSSNPDQWEMKGAQIFRRTTPSRYPHQLRVFDDLVHALVREFNGRLFYYVDEKIQGTPKQVQVEPHKREADAMRQTLNRVATFADRQEQNVLTIIDQVDEKQRTARLGSLYAHILGRAAEHREMHRIIEPPMHVDSALSANVQFADWVAGFISRWTDYQLLLDSRHAWIATEARFRHVHGSFTNESKLHLYQRSINDLVHSDILRANRLLYPVADGARILERVPPDALRKLRAARGR